MRITRLGSSRKQKLTNLTFGESGVSRRGEDFLQFPEVPDGAIASTRLFYVQIYIDLNIFDPTQFYVNNVQLSIIAFVRVDVRFLSLLVMNIVHLTYDG